jgi:CHASE3 domain sensor protein
MLNRLKIGTKIGASFALGLLFFAVLSAVSYRSTNQLVETSTRESHTYEVIGQIEELLSRLKDAETGQRGYVITGSPKYLEPYNNAIRLLDGRTRARLRELIKDNPAQQHRLDAVDPLVTAKLVELDQTIKLRQQQGFAAAKQAVQTDRGMQLMSDIRQLPIA